MSTETLANTSPTGGSCGSDLNGPAVMDACQKVMARLEPYRTPQRHFFYFNRLFSKMFTVISCLGIKWNTQSWIVSLILHYSACFFLQITKLFRHLKGIPTLDSGITVVPPPLKNFHITILLLFYINLGIAVIFFSFLQKFSKINKRSPMFIQESRVVGFGIWFWP